MDLGRFFHRLMNPHCPYCLREEQEMMDRQECKTCDVLRGELERAHRLIDKLTSPKVIEIPAKQDDSELKPIPTNRRSFVPMAVRQQMQDKADQRTLDLLVAASKKAEPIVVSEEKVVDDKKVEEMERDILSVEPAKEVNG